MASGSGASSHVAARVRGGRSVGQHRPAGAEHGRPLLDGRFQRPVPDRDVFDLVAEAEADAHRGDAGREGRHDRPADLQHAGVAPQVADRRAQAAVGADHRLVVAQLLHVDQGDGPGIPGGVVGAQPDERHGELRAPARPRRGTHRVVDGCSAGDAADGVDRALDLVPTVVVAGGVAEAALDRQLVRRGLGRGRRREHGHHGAGGGQRARSARPVREPHQRPPHQDGHCEPLTQRQEPTARVRGR